MRTGTQLALVVLLVAVVGALALHLPGVRSSAAPAFQPEHMLAGTSTASTAADTSTSPAKTTTKLCADQPNTFSCYQTYYSKLVADKGPEAAFADIRARYNTDPYVASQCHPIMHVIGRAASAFYPTVGEAFKHGDSFCWSGYYHGILEGFIAKVGIKNLPSKLNSICADIPGKASYNFDYYNCVHGLGHGIMELESDDVFASLKMCDDLTGSWEQQSCWSGVFMENIIAYDRDGFSAYLKRSEPLYPCTDVDDKYKTECYLGQTSFALQLNGFDFADGFKQCNAVNEPYRDTCNQSIGRDAAGSTNDDPVRTLGNCAKAPDQNAMRNCVVGAVKDIISYYHDTQKAMQFCNLLDPTNKQTCTDTATAYYAAL